MFTVSSIAAFSSLFISILVLFFRAGHLSARVESLELWRTNLRTDMHEISQVLQKLELELNQVHTLILERTERRKESR